MLRFNIARSCSKDGYIRFNQLIKAYARKRSVTGTTHAVVQTIVTRGTIIHNSNHIWAACFLLLGFENDPVVIDTKASELPFLVKEVILPLAIIFQSGYPIQSIRGYILAGEALVTPVEKRLDKSLLIFIKILLTILNQVNKEHLNHLDIKFEPAPTYVLYKDLGDAYRLFDEMLERNSVSWSVMVDEFDKAGDYMICFEIFWEYVRMMFDKR
ncbi:hypothetical protein Tco_0827834 [Tanacetum coccineum]